jgi:flagellar basal-body rod modification protein FlgD
MSVISSSQDLFTGLGMSADSRTAGPANDPTQIGLNTFLKLMVTQLNNQDPFKPMENGDFLGQIAQFASVTGLDKLNNNFDGPGHVADLRSGVAGGDPDRPRGAGADRGRLPAAGRPVARAGAARGEHAPAERPHPRCEWRHGTRPVDGFPVGGHGADQLGRPHDGRRPRPHRASTRSMSRRSPAKAVERQQTLLFSRVESVGVNNGSGLTLNLEGLGPIAFNNVKQVSNWE